MQNQDSVRGRTHKQGTPLKKTLRASLTIVMTGGLLLAATGCMAPTPGASDAQASPGQPAPTAQQHNFPVGGEKSMTFESPMRTTQVFPAKWAGGDGWTQAGVDEIVALPHHIGYSLLNTATGETGFKMYNDKGEIVAEIGAPEELGSLAFRYAPHDVVSVWQDGKKFTLYVQAGNDVNNDTHFIVTTFDENANQLHRKVLTPQLEATGVNTDKGVLSFEEFTVEEQDEVFNPVTGELEVAPESTNGRWQMRVNGVDIFAKDGEYSTGDWSLKYAGIEPLGKYISASIADERGNSTGVCDIIDPQTGDIIEGNDGACATPWQGETDKEDHRSPTNGFILYKTMTTVDGENYTNEVLFQPSGDSHTVKNEDNIGTVDSVDDEGTFYGWQHGPSGSNAKNVAVTLNADNNFAPEQKDGVTVLPIVVSGNGIAAFNADGKFDDSGRINFVLPKK